MQQHKVFCSISVRKQIIFLIILFLVANKRIQCDICDLCSCTQLIDFNCNTLSNNNQCFNKNNFICDGTDQKFKKFNQTIQLDNVEWPNGKNVSASFNHLKLTFLAKLFCSKSSILTEINLDNNLIESVTNDPFKYCTNLKIVSISYNRLQRLPQDFLKSLTYVERLILSYNALTEFRVEILSKQLHLIELDLSHNQITTLKINEILRQSPNIEIINAAFNELYLINGDSSLQHYALKRLNLAGNKLTVLTSSTFTAYPNLQQLNLSSNELRNIEEDTFATLDKLQYLDLSLNKLKDISLNLSSSIEHLILIKNNLNYWPMKNVPVKLSVLELQSNNLNELVDHTELPNVKLLNISHNNIQNFPSQLQCPKLEILDLSYNRLTYVPTEIGRQTPILDWLRMNGNPMEEIQMNGKVVARKLELSEMPLLRELNASQFSVLDSKNGCIEITVSHCPLLKTVRNSFAQTIDLCALDLSYNAISVIDENLTSWPFLTQGIDLQGNPFQCTCQDAQWMLDIILPLLYNEKKHQHYLQDLRCAIPAHLAQHRLLRYFKHERAFCAENVSKNKIHKRYFGLLAADENDESNDFRIDEGVGMIIAICILAVIFLASVLIVTMLVRRYRLRKLKKNNRRFDSGGFF